MYVSQTNVLTTHGQSILVKWQVVQNTDALQDNFAKIMAAYENRTLSVWLEVAEQFGVNRETGAQLTGT